MDIDLSILRMLEREKEISFDVLVEAIEQALLTAYHKTPGAQETARVQLDRKSGHVTVLADRGRRRGQRGRRVRRHPRRLRPDRRHDREADHAAAAPRRRGRPPLRRVLRQGGRHHLRHHPAGPQPRRRDGRPRQARGAAAGRRAGPGRALRARHAASSAWWSRSARACAARRSRCRAPTPTWSRSSSRSRSPRSPTAPSRSPAIAREAGHRTKIAVWTKASGRQRQGRLHRADGPAGPQRDVRAARREDRHRRLVRGPRRAGRARAVAGPGHRSRDRRPRGALGAGSSCPTSSSRWRSARRVRTPASPPG